MLILDIFSLQDLIDLMQSIFHRDFVRKVRCKHTGLWPDAFNDIGQRALIPLTTNEKFTACKVIDNWFLATKLSVLPLAL